MKPIIICKRETNQKQTFYMIYGMKEYYLLSQKYSRSVDEEFSKGVEFTRTHISNKGKRNYLIMKTMEKLYLAIRYIEKEQNMAILEKTNRKTKNHYHQRNVL